MKRTAGLRYEFDSIAFARDLESACRDMDVKMATVAADVGIEPSTLSRMVRRGLSPNGPTLVALAAYSGLDLMLYVVDLGEAAMPRQLHLLPDRTYRGALVRIRELEDELEKARATTTA